MKITRDEARRIADLAHLEFDDPSLDRLAADMTTILGYIEQIATSSLSPPQRGEGPRSGGEGPPHPASGHLLPRAAGEKGNVVLREDEIRPSLPRETVEANAPAWSDGFFVVPKVIG